MKISEIIITPSTAEISSDKLQPFLDSLDQKGKLLDRISSTLSLKHIDNTFYILTKNDKSIGWLELDKPINIKNVQYNVIKMLYVVPEIRKTFAVGAFLIALKNHIKDPLILGSDKFGGVLFKDGEQLIKQLNNSVRFDVKYLDLTSSEKTELDDVLKSGKNTTLIFECLNFPLSKKIMNGTVELFIFEDSENQNSFIFL